ncbi:hypothetical protein DFQ14_104270 [Halopolyspora algeriensis]|uniref:Regulatory protein n=1 Tax=Halopolyspora algeriensis TaxID=1500506 RepID=A0A368VS08_9ACTN|nr:hypothetical protein [Halopolyspora algeriensis]RCW44680.1 hypothetical protein DFQ14_104270 [Halopolyspora algeriensis]TQM56038.1 hypothetical protein FHU43_0820 [Halopolyspora algeriensis]
MRLIIDTSQVSFTVGREATPKTDQNGIQRTDRNTKEPLFAVQLVAVDDGGAEVINVTVAGANPPQVTKGQPVTPTELQAIPWAQNGRNGVAFRATAITPNAAAAGSAKSASSGQSS